jgi:hypothetical protein
MTDIALFPIPNCVSFPGSALPLHVFEPRYRAMVNHCIEQQMLMGVCHTAKTIRESDPDQSLEQALQSNQATYKPHRVFSAGRCVLLDTLPDGRMHIAVNMAARYRAVEELQTLPFSIYRCEEYVDEEADPQTLAQTALLQDKILRRLIAMTSSMPEAQQRLQSEEWQAKDPLAFSLAVFGMVGADPDAQQEVLELRRPDLRLERLLDWLNQ